jgi:Fe-Mn family superoxide dismutase
LKTLNDAIEKHSELFEWSLETLLTNLEQVPDDIRTAVRNNGGGVYNHNLYWVSMAPGQAGEPGGMLAKEIKASFGNFDNFESEFEKAALSRFGSGYCWLSNKSNGAIVIHTAANQDCPLKENLKPIIVVDVWEHAYYLKYQNRRADYLSSWWSVVNWESADNNYGNAV